MSPTLTRRALLLALLTAPLSAAAKPKPRPKPKPQRALTRLKGDALKRARSRRALILFTHVNDAWAPVFKGRYISEAGTLHVLKERGSIHGDKIGSISAAQLTELRRLLDRCVDSVVIEGKGWMDAGVDAYVGFVYKEGEILEIKLDVSKDLVLVNQTPEAAQIIERFDAHFAAAGHPSSAPREDAPLIPPW